jgi:hypothetical protein
MPDITIPEEARQVTIPDEAWDAVVEACPIADVNAAKGSAWDINDLQQKAVEAAAPFIAAALARELLEDLDAQVCAFWACDGPDEEPVNMKTCQVCSTIYRLRQIVARAAELRGGDTP